MGIPAEPQRALMAAGAVGTRCGAAGARVNVVCVRKPEELNGCFVAHLPMRENGKQMGESVRVLDRKGDAAARWAADERIGDSERAGFNGVAAVPVVDHAGAPEDRCELASRRCFADGLRAGEDVGAFHGASVVREAGRVRWP